MLRAGWTRAVRYGLPGVFLGLGLAWLLGGRGLAAQGTSRLLGGDAPGTIAFATASANGGQILYIVDPQSQSFAFYKVDPTAKGAGTVKLEGARNYKYDLKLTDYNNHPPDPGMVETMIRSAPPSKPH